MIKPVAVNYEEAKCVVASITGFTAYFASLTPKFRQLVADRFLK